MTFVASAGMRPSPNHAGSAIRSDLGTAMRASFRWLARYILCAMVGVNAAASAAGSGQRASPPIAATPSGPVKVFAFLVKRPDLTDAQFFAHWRDPHGTMTKKIPQFRRYVQNHGIGAVPTVPGLAPTAYLGSPNLWLDSEADMAAAGAEPDYAPLDRDGDELYLRDKLVWVIGNETVVAHPDERASATPVKAMLLLKGTHGALDPATLAAIAAKAQATFPTLAGVTYTSPTNPAASPFDGIVELFFADLPAFRSAWGDGAFVARLPAAVDRAASRGFLAREERVIWPDGGR